MFYMLLVFMPVAELDYYVDYKGSFGPLRIKNTRKIRPKTRKTAIKFDQNSDLDDRILQHQKSNQCCTDSAIQLNLERQWSHVEAH